MAGQAMDNGTGHTTFETIEHSDPSDDQKCTERHQGSDDEALDLVRPNTSECQAEQEGKLGK